MFTKRKSIAFTGAVAAVAALGLSVYTASAGATGAPSYTCTGGSIPGGTYSSLIVNGNCNVDDGDVHVVNNVTLKPNASLWVNFGGNNLTVGGSIQAGKNTNLILGCFGYAGTCFDNREESAMATATVKHDVVTSGARVVAIQGSHIGGSITQTGGGGGDDARTCEVNPQVSQSFDPPQSYYDSNSIGGDVTITGVHTCNLYLYNNSVGLSVTYTGNKTYETDGNKIDGNGIGRNLACVGNVPPPHVDNAYNYVHGLATGQCKNLVVPTTTTTATDGAPLG